MGRRQVYPGVNSLFPGLPDLRWCSGCSSVGEHGGVSAGNWVPLHRKGRVSGRFLSP